MVTWGSGWGDSNAYPKKENRKKFYALVEARSQFPVKSETIMNLVKLGPDVTLSLRQNG